jgi:predicted phage-related endonuclease
VTLTEAQRAIRRGRITASIAPSILRVEGSFGSPLTAWLEIMDMPREDIGTMPRVRAGNYFEAGVCAWWQDDVGTPNELQATGDGSQTLVHPVHDWLAVTPDRFVVDGTGRRVATLQAKTSAAWNREKWEDLDTHEVILPDSVRIQCALELEVVDLERAYVAVVLGGNRPYFTMIERDRALAAECMKALGAWHLKHVVGNLQPEPTGYECDTRAFRYLHPSDTGELVSLDAETAGNAEESKRIDEQIESLKVERDRLRNVVRAALGTATFGEAPGLLATYKTNRKGVRSLRIDQK